MYNDFRNTKRDSWTFTYTGEQLLQHAAKKKDYYRNKELTARQRVSELIADPNVRANDQEVTRLKSEIEDYADQYEKCVIWCHEFERNRHGEFRLSLGDVSYFDIAEQVSNPATEDPS